MLQSYRRQAREAPPNKIAGFVYVGIGIVGLMLAAFVVLVEGKLGPVSNFRIGLGIVIAIWGLFRIYTGFSTIRKAARASQKVILPGKDSAISEPNPPLQ